jgi:hypothetical protein
MITKKRKTNETSLQYKKMKSNTISDTITAPVSISYSTSDVSITTTGIPCHQICNVFTSVQEFLEHGYVIEKRPNPKTRKRLKSKSRKNHG